MNISSHEVKLIEPIEELREEFIAVINEYQHMGESLDDWELARSDFPAYLLKLGDEKHGLNLPSGIVPMTTYWMVNSDQLIIGESRLRHYLTVSLEEYGGHIGYEIRPSERRKGYGKKILELTLERAVELNIHRVRVTCDTDNIGSARIIKHNGGILSGHGISPKNGKPTSQYWIEI